MPVVDHVSPRLNRVHVVPFHQPYNLLVGLNLVLPHNDSLGLVLVTRCIVPFAFPDLIDFEPSFRVDVQNTSQNIFGISRQYFGQFKISSDDFFVQFICVGVFEREVAAQHGIQNDSARPNVCIKALIFFACDHLRSGIARRATGSFEFFSGFILIGEPKVYNFDVFVMIEEQILWFEISVYDSVFVDVLHTCNDLLHEPDGFGFIEPLPFDDVVEEFTAFSILHDEVDVGFGFDDLVELDDVGMAEYFEDADFAGDTFDV